MKRPFGPYSAWRWLAILSFAAAVGAFAAGVSGDGGFILAAGFVALHLLLLAADALAVHVGGGPTA